MRNETDIISNGSARLGQLLILMFFILFILFLTFIILFKNSSPTGIAFLVAFCGLTWVIIKQAMSFADVTITNKKMKVNKIFGSKTYSLSDIKDFDKGLLPYTFYVELSQLQRVYFYNISHVDCNGL